MKEIVVNIRRHSLSNKQDKKKDYSISPEGWNLAVEEGKKLAVPDGGIRAYSSPKNRAIETATGILYGAHIANYSDREIRWADSVITVPELDSMARHITKIPDVRKVFDSMLLDDAVNLVLKEDPEAVAKAGEEIKGFMGYAIYDFCYNNQNNPDEKEISSFLIEGVTHGPKIEAGLIGLLGDAVNDIREIGGACREAEFLSVNAVLEGEKYRLVKVSYKDVKKDICIEAELPLIEKV